MSMRVTNQTIYASEGVNVQSSLAALANAQQQATTGKRIQRPSDDPAGTAAALRIRQQAAANNQYSRNISDGTSWLTAADGALTQTSTLLRKARDLAIQSVNGTNNQDSLNALAEQLEGIKSSLLAQANTQLAGRSVFAGTSNAGAAYTSSTTPPAYSFTGNSTDAVTRRVGEGQSVRVDVDGSSVFGATGSTVFDQLDSMIATLRSGGDLESSVATIDTDLSSVASAQAQVGAAENAVQNAKTAQQSTSVALTQQQSSVENVDTALAALNLTNANNIYQATLLVTSNTMQTNLTDFLR